MNINFLILITNLFNNIYKSIFQNVSVFADEVSENKEVSIEKEVSNEVLENEIIKKDIEAGTVKEIKSDILSMNSDSINSNIDQKIYAYDKQLGFQDAYTPIMEGIINLHHDILTWLVAIVIFILWLIIKTVSNFYHTNNRYSNEIQHNESLILEIVWTIIPSVILLSIAIPSFALLYSIDEIIDPVLTIKVIGYQWYWEYEYPDFNQNQLVFQSYMINESDLAEGELRLLEVDNRLVIPTNMHIRILVTANDVLHSWAVPSLGVKMDAVPGRLNQISLFCKKTGIYYGQCSEICGVNHGFMPIVVESIPFNDFLRWFNFKVNQA